MLEKIKALYQKYHELISYVFWGVMTTLVNFIVYFPLANWLHMDVFWADFIANVVSILFAFVVNKWFVFKSKDLTFVTLLKEFLIFVSGRVFSLFLELGLVELNDKVWGFDPNIFKIIVTVVVIILNFLVSKFIAFRKAKPTTEEEKK